MSFQRTLIAMVSCLALLLSACAQSGPGGQVGDVQPSPSPQTTITADQPTATSEPQASPTIVAATEAPEASATPAMPDPPLPTAISETPPPGGDGTAPPALIETVSIYLVSPQAGDEGCNDGLVPVERQVEPTPAPLTAAISELLALDDRTLGQAGLYNALYQSDLEIESLALSDDGRASIRLNGELQLGGACDAPRVRAQLMNTALQFSTVQSADIFINGEPLNQALSLQPEPPTFEQVTIYLIAEGQGDVGCGDRLVPVERQVEPTPAPLTAAISELLALDHRTLGQSGLYNPLYQSQLQIESVEITDDGTATIRLTGDFQIGGVCDAPRVESVLRSTALQFQTVNSVEVSINDQPMAELLSGR